ncbi:hypothetical protein HON01_02125 [Candidatus Woesearchaeota archaeon]|nr:hypothetical protein [Candidatus Woesearchaeota archaeon]
MARIKKSGNSNCRSNCRSKSMFLISRKAQDGTKAATLVAVIALLIIFYLLFIPPHVRQEILEGNSTDSDSDSYSGSNKTLLLENPGTLTSLSTKEITHSIPALTIFATQDAQVLDTQSSLTAKKSWFSDTSAEFTFVIQDLTHTENLLLTFVSKIHEGNMRITLNGKDIFNQEITKENPDPVVVPKKYVAQGANKLEFFTESVGWQFWKVNKHTLENLQITGDITDITQQQSKNIFIVSATEKNNLKRGRLIFTPQCELGVTGKLQALVNNHLVYEAIPDCGYALGVEFAPDILRNGENQIVFKTEKGNYIVELIKIKSELKEIVQPVYFFDLDEDEFDDVEDDSDDIYLKITFVDDNEQKEGRININGVETNIYQRDRVYKKKINDYLIEGNNAIKIIPDEILQIVELEVYRDN